MRGVRTCDGAVDDGTVLELDGDRLIVQFHQKSTRSTRVSLATHNDINSKQMNGRARASQHTAARQYHRPKERSKRS